MFRRLLDATGETLQFTLDGKLFSGLAGDSVSAAMLAAGANVSRTTSVSGVPRAPYCMMGVCFDCLVTIDGVGNRQGCLIPLQDGMRLEKQNGARAVGEMK